MSFAFEFSGDDIETDNENDGLVQRVADYTIDDISLISPKKHTLEDLKEEYISQTQVVVPRRCVFDIRTQLMAEANPEENENDTILTDLEHGDLTSGVYEGGFKTWECSTDLASLVAGLKIKQDLSIIELGAGSAIPSIVALQMALGNSTHPAIHFTLCDYNEDVLRFATAPNIFLAADLALQRHQRVNTNDDLDIEDIDLTKVRKCVESLNKKNLSFEFISGAWGDEFVRLVQSPSQHSLLQARTILVLASETIYSPKSTSTFVETLMQLLQRDPINSKAWIAAKKVYFGVGGGVDEFVDQVKARNGSVKMLLDVTGAGVGRVVLEVVSKS